MLLKLHRNTAGIGAKTKEHEIFVNPYDITTVERGEYGRTLITFTSDRQLYVMEEVKDVVIMVESATGVQ